MDIQKLLGSIESAAREAGRIMLEAISSATSPSIRIFRWYSSRCTCSVWESDSCWPS